MASMKTAQNHQVADGHYYMEFQIKELTRDMSDMRQMNLKLRQETETLSKAQNALRLKQDRVASEIKKKLELVEKKASFDPLENPYALQRNAEIIEMEEMIEVAVRPSVT